MKNVYIGVGRLFVAAAAAAAMAAAAGTTASGAAVVETAYPELKGRGRHVARTRRFKGSNEAKRATRRGGNQGAW